LSVVPNNTEKFLSVQADKFLFLDSMQFLPESLDSLVSNLSAGGKQKFSVLTEVFGDRSKYLMRKGIYPYDFMDDWSKFDQTKFPHRRYFFISLKDDVITEKEYEYGKHLYKDILQCENLGVCHDIYLTCDTLLLACVFEDFRRMALETYSLDLTYYYSAPGLAFDDVY
jgi:hypothetical protein